MMWKRVWKYKFIFEMTLSLIWEADGKKITCYHTCKGSWVNSRIREKNLMNFELCRLFTLGIVSKFRF